MQSVRAVRHQRRCRLRRAVSAVLVASAVASLASCGRMVVLATEPWWSAVTAGRADLPRRLAVAALRRGYLPSVIAVAAREDARERLAAALSRQRATVAVLGPPLSFGARDLAATFTNVTFILVGGPGADDGIGNTIQLVFDRTGAFREAGALAAASGPVAVLSAAGRPEEETAAFIEGVLAAAGAAAPVTRNVGEIPDLERLKSAIAELRDAGVSAFLYRPTSSGAVFLDVLAAAGGCAVVEDWAASRPRQDQVIASIEEDLPAGIHACLARNAPPVVTAAAALVRGGAAGTVRGGAATPAAAGGTATPTAAGGQ